MRANQFTQGAQTVLRLAQEEAGKLGHSYIGSEHLLLGILGGEDGDARRALDGQGVSASRARETAVRLVGKGLAGLPPSQGLTPRARHIIESAASLCRRQGEEHVGTEHLLVGILREEGCMAGRILAALGVDGEKLAAALMQRMGSRRPSPPRAQRETPPRPAAVREDGVRSKALEQFCRSLNTMAREGRLDPVVGREREIERTVRILSRRTKNNPVLIGEPGVGKTAVAEGLAQRIVDGDVPEELRGMTVLSMDLASMLAGTKYRGEFEERVKNALAEVRRRENIILFIDEIHTIVGAGSAEGSVDAGNILKPALGRGEIRVLGATTPEEYRRYIEKDAALERRFQTVRVEEPDRDTAVRILRALRGRYEAHHRLVISDEAVDAAVDLSRRYLPGRFLPDKAIDLLDEACSSLRLTRCPGTEEITLLERRLEEVRRDKAAAAAGEDFEGAAQLRDVEEDFSCQLAQARRSVAAAGGRGLSAEDVAEVAAEWTGIPVRRISRSEGERLLRLEEAMKKSIVGQDEAASKIARCIRRARMGLNDPDRPVGSFLFLGATGVGKTALCRALARELFGGEEALVRLDMSEFSEAHSVSRLVGAPPGYVGHDDGGQLTERVRRRPYCVVLLDEIEKAHSDVWAMLLQIMEDGRLTDSHGRQTDFRNTVIVMTGNAGARHLTGGGCRLGFSAEETEGRSEAEAALLAEVRRIFPAEFLARVDETVIFRGLDETQLREIARRMIHETALRLAPREMTLTVEEDALRLLARESAAEGRGARPLRRLIRLRVEEPVADGLLEGTFRPGDALTVTAQQGEVAVTHCERETAVS